MIWAQNNLGLIFGFATGCAKIGKWIHFLELLSSYVKVETVIIEKFCIKCFI